MEPKYLTFEEALKCLKLGHLVSRKHSELGEQFGAIAYQNGYDLNAGVTANPNTQKAFHLSEGIHIAHAPYLQRAVCMEQDESGAFPRMLSFYTPTTKDLLANDWYCVG